MQCRKPANEYYAGLPLNKKTTPCRVANYCKALLIYCCSSCTLFLCRQHEACPVVLYVPLAEFQSQFFCMVGQECYVAFVESA